MKWTNLTSDLRFGSLSSLLRELSALDSIQLLHNRENGKTIYITSTCKANITAHVNSHEKEIGGLLLGKVWIDDLEPYKLSRPIVIITKSVQAQNYKNSQISLEMGSDIWVKVNDYDTNLIVVGWYHSHPNLGAFFSITDRNTQEAFFNNPYSVGWVIDPYRIESKAFVGQSSELYSHKFMELKNGLEMA